ncbi:MAG: NAD(P)/FAD-dependent oxidoreductase, partial [Acidobacteriota bacterium]
GLSCAYELARLGHDPIVLEASGRAGGHVRTLKDPFADGLYADVGAEHFYYPGYTRFWSYIKEFGLTPVAYPRRDQLLRFFKTGGVYSEADLRSATILNKLEFNSRECAFLAEHPWSELPLLYFSKYVEAIRDERNPFEGNLRELDSISVGDLLQKEGASVGAVRHFGGSGSALHMIWGAAVKKLRGTPFESKKLFRLLGGNQAMTDAFAARLKERVRCGSPVTQLEHSGSGVTVTSTVMGEPKKFEADYLVIAISLAVLRQMQVTPAWPESKNYLVQQMPYTTKTRVVFQTRTRFWETDKVSPNWSSSDPKLSELWAMAEELKTPRGILVGGSQPGVSAAATRGAFLQSYSGKSADIEHITLHEWAKDPWAGMCERSTYRPGDLTRFWPEAGRPVGRVHFAGAYAAQMSWGMEAALESAHLAAKAIDQAA